MDTVLNGRKIAPHKAVWAVTAFVYLAGACVALTVGEFTAMSFFVFLALGSVATVLKASRNLSLWRRDPSCVTTRSHSIVSTLPRSVY